MLIVTITLTHWLFPPGMTDNSSKKSDKKQREKLGLAPVPKGKGTSRTPPPEPTNALQKVEVCGLTSLFHSDSSLLSICSQGFFGRQVEKAKQDDALSDLSNVLGELKNMAFDMGGELDRSEYVLIYIHFLSYLTD